jgi:transmembrane sensor
MSEAADSIAGTASAWHVASVSDAMDWDGFIAWLEADARHAAAFDEVAMADALIETHRISLRKGDVISAYGRQPKVATRPRLWLRWGGTAFAAALIAMVAVPQFRQKAPVEYTTADAARSIALNEGSTIHLAPHSRLTVAGRRDEQITLTGGAWFDVHHDPERRMTIAAGEVTVSTSRPQVIGSGLRLRRAALQFRLLRSIHRSLSPKDAPCSSTDPPDRFVRAKWRVKTSVRGERDG